MNHEKNTNFLQNTRNDKKYRDWSCIYPDRNKQWEKTFIFFKIRIELKKKKKKKRKVSKLKLYLPSQKLTMCEALILIPKTQKMVLDAALPNTQHHKVVIKGKVEQSRERSRALPYTSL